MSYYGRLYFPSLIVTFSYLYRVCAPGITEKKVTEYQSIAPRSDAIFRGYYTRPRFLTFRFFIMIPADDQKNEKSSRSTLRIELLDVARYESH